MPTVAFTSLPRDARVWVFAADRALRPAESAALLREVDAFLAQWNAHGHALRCARDWRDDRFLAIGVDQSVEGASGCSIDGLFRVLQRVQPEVGASLLPGGRVFWRDVGGEIRSGTRAEFSALSRNGTLGAGTPVFDTTAATAADWDALERPAGASWHATLLR
jgi:hypothetical protein